MAKSILKLPAEANASLGDALFVGNFPSGSDEWHELRARGIGGSDVGTICGVNPWESPFSWWAKRTGRIPSVIEPNEAMEWGSRLESVILDKFKEVHLDLLVNTNPGSWRNKDRDWQLANPDGIYKTKSGDFGIIEVKTARYEDDWLNGVPSYYRTQVQWYLQTFGFKHAYVVALFSGSKYREYEIEADHFEQSVNLGTVENFLPFLVEDRQPDFDGATATLQSVKQMHPLIEDTEIELGEIYEAYVDALRAEEAVVNIANMMRCEILELMGTAKRGLFNDKVVVTRQSRNGGTPYLVNKRS